MPQSDFKLISSEPFLDTDVTPLHLFAYPDTTLQDDGKSTLPIEPIPSEGVRNDIREETLSQRSGLSGNLLKDIPRDISFHLKFYEDMFDVLCTDVYDILVSRRALSDGSELDPRLLARVHLPPERNRARQSLAALRKDLLDNIAVEICLEIRRRYSALRIHEPQSSSTNAASIPSNSLQSEGHGGFSRSHPEVVQMSGLTRGMVLNNNNDNFPSDHSTGIQSSNASPRLDTLDLANDDAYDGILNEYYAGGDVDNSIRAHRGDHTPVILHRPGEGTNMTTPISSTLEPFSKNSRLCLDGQISRRSKYIAVSGGYADLWTGVLGNQTVAIKTLRPFSSMGLPIEKDKLFKRLWREYLAWSCLRHPNILSCLGFSNDFLSSESGVPSLISPWMSNGTVLSYIARNPTCNRLHIISGVARGLSFLHNRVPAIIHGDIRAGNILVSNSGIPCLTDFGLSRILGDTRGMTTSSVGTGSLRWMSPELFQNDKASENSDIWAFGMTVLEIYSGKRPYHEFNLEPVVLHRIIDGLTPSRPVSSDTHLAPVTDQLWSICQRCWNFEPSRRPRMFEVTLQLMAEQAELKDMHPYAFAVDSRSHWSTLSTRNRGPLPTEPKKSMARKRAGGLWRF